MLLVQAVRLVAAYGAYSYSTDYSASIVTQAEET